MIKILKNLKLKKKRSKEFLNFFLIKKIDVTKNRLFSFQSINLLKNNQYNKVPFISSNPIKFDKLIS